MTVLAAQTYVRRGQLPGGGVPFTGRAAISSLQEALQDYDDRFELHDLGALGIVGYRVKNFGPHSGSDELVLQFKLEAPPGMWLLESMKRHDRYRQYGDPSRIAKGVLTKQDQLEQSQEEARKLHMKEVHKHAASEIINYGLRGRRTVSLT